MYIFISIILWLIVGIVSDSWQYNLYIRDSINPIYKPNLIWHIIGGPVALCFTFLIDFVD